MMRRAASIWWAQASATPAAAADAVLQVWPTAGLADRDLRMATCLLAGPTSLESAEVLSMLIDQCSLDPDWRVQEMFAKALTWRCELAGWQHSEPELRKWLTDPRTNVRRAAAEGPRVWTRRPYFADHPELVLDLLGLLRNDPSTYARTSAANAISDISKAHPDLVLTALRTWSESGADDDNWLLRHAGRHLAKTHPQAMHALGSNSGAA